jgi:hypothetical protein
VGRVLPLKLGAFVLFRSVERLRQVGFEVGRPYARRHAKRLATLLDGLKLFLVSGQEFFKRCERGVALLPSCSTFRDQHIESLCSRMHCVRGSSPHPSGIGK